MPIKLALGLALTAVGKVVAVFLDGGNIKTRDASGILTRNGDTVVSRSVS